MTTTSGAPNQLGAAVCARRWSTRGARLAIGVLVLLASFGPATTTGAAARAGLGWKASELVVPKDAAASPNPVLFSTVCFAVRQCVMVGGYTTGSGAQEGLIQTLSGARETSSTAPVPADAASDPQLELLGLSCTSPAFCVAVGTYTDHNDNPNLPLFEMLAAGEWTVARPLLPPDAASQPFAGISFAPCTQPGLCIAVGTYQTRDSGKLPFSDTLDGGVSAPIRLPLPPDALAGPLQNAITYGMACFSTTDCLVVGTYVNASSVFNMPFVDSLSHGTWTAAAIPLPRGANATQPLTAIDAMSCATASSCVAAGNYVEENGSTQGFFEQLDGGAWTATTAPLPEGFDPNPLVLMSGVSCPVAGRCTAAGEGFRSGTTRGVIFELASGHWTPVLVPQPDPSDPTNAALGPISCGAPDVCAALGNSALEGLLVTVVHNVLQVVVAPLPAPGAAPPAPFQAGGSIACPTASWCAAVGTFETAVIGAGFLQLGVLEVLSG